MTKSELITKISERFPQLTSNDASDAVNAILSAITARLASPGGRIEVRGFGSFTVHVRPPRRGRNPKTGESVSVPAKAVPHFKAGVELRARVNGEEEKVEKARLAA